MKADVNGCSTCPRGQEHWEGFIVNGKWRCQYDYRTPDGRLFSCVARTLEEARTRRDAWYRRPTANS